MMHTQPKTAQGRYTRDKIVAAAAHLVHTGGVHGTSVDKIITASEAGKSQFYHYFKSKDAVIEAIIEHHKRHYMTPMLDSLATVDSIDGLKFWSDTVIETSPFLNGTPILGCPLAMLADELAANNDSNRALLSDKLDEIKDAYVGVLKRIQTSAEISRNADINALAESMVCMVQGGLLLAKIHQDLSFMRNAIAQWTNYLRLLA